MPDYQLIKVMNEATLAALSTVPTTMAGTECAVIDLYGVDDFALTVECEFGTAATGNLVFSVFTSPTGGSTNADEWDTEAYADGTLQCVAATRVQKTVVIEGDPKYAKVWAVTEGTVAVTNLVMTKHTKP